MLRDSLLLWEDLHKGFILIKVPMPRKYWLHLRNPHTFSLRRWWVLRSILVLVLCPPASLGLGALSDAQPLHGFHCPILTFITPCFPLLLSVF